MMPEWDAIHEKDFELAIAMDSGDQDKVDRLLFEAKRDLVEEALQDNFDTSIKTTGEIAERGKLQAKAKDLKGLSNTPESINAYLMTFDSMRDGPIREDIENINDKMLREAAEQILSSAAISNLAKGGLRDGVSVLSDKNRIGRAADRVVDYGYGVDRNTGALIAGMPTEGGHSDNFPHATYPEYSNARWNMGTEQKYINKTKGKRTGDDALTAMRNSLKNRMHADPTGDVIRSVVNGWQVGEGFGPMIDNMSRPKTMRESLQAQAELQAQALLNERMQGIIGENITDSQGQIVGEKPLVINADEGSQVFVHTNGNGHKNGRAKVQQAFNKAARK